MFVQHAKGDFWVHVNGDWHCGPDPSNPKRLKYDVRIEYPNEALDCHGFLIDNLEFTRYFDSITETSDSCELLAKNAADYFCQLCKHRETKVNVDITIPGLAGIQYEELESDQEGNQIAGIGGDRLMGRVG